MAMQSNLRLMVLYITAFSSPSHFNVKIKSGSASYMLHNLDAATATLQFNITGGGPTPPHWLAHNLLI